MALGLGIGLSKMKRVSGGAAPYTPAQDTDLFDWWDAQSGVTTSSGELTAWVGTVNSVTANPPTVTSRPLYGTDTINSLNVMTFRGVDPNYLVVDFTALTSTSCTISILMNVIDSRGVIFQTNNSKTVQFRSGNVSSAFAGISNGSVYFNNVFVGSTNTMTRDELYTVIFLNTGVLTITNINFSAVTSGTFFTEILQGDPTDCKAGDIIITGAVTERENNDNFLMTKYGL